MRIIDADELVRYLKQYHSMSQGVISDVEHFPTAHMAIEALEKQATSDSKQATIEWIPCGEMLPEDMQRCITTAIIHFTPDHVDEDSTCIGVELNTYSKEFGWLYNLDVLAWMPLPEPYKDGEQND